MASISSKGEVAMKECGVGEKCKGFGLDSVDMMEGTRDYDRLLGRKAEFSALSMCLYFQGWKY